jgi:hypothetical protein
MKTKKKSRKVQKPFYTFEFPEYGYDIALIPRDEEYRTMLKCQARSYASLEFFVLTEIENSLPSSSDCFREENKKTKPADSK